MKSLSQYIFYNSTFSFGICFMQCEVEKMDIGNWSGSLHSMSRIWANLNIPIRKCSFLIHIVSQPHYIGLVTEFKTNQRKQQQKVLGNQQENYFTAFSLRFFLTVINNAVPPQTFLPKLPNFIFVWIFQSLKVLTNFERLYIRANLH